MKKCDPNARARCPDGKICELYAEYAEGSWCDTFNESVLKQPMINADRIRAMSDEELGRFLAEVENRRSAAAPGAVWKGSAHAIQWLRQPVKEVEKDA